MCAVMVEFIQGEGGVIPLEKAYVEALFALCQKRDILIIADEVQTGMGRTGKLLAGAHFGVKADIVTLAKGLGGGLPIGACLARVGLEAVMDLGSHGSTFGGNPVVCAGALAVLEQLQKPEFLAQVAEKGSFLKEKLQSLPGIASVSGLGLMLGAKLEEGSAKEIVAAALEEGLILLTAKEKLRFLPPLNITQEELAQGIKILQKVLEKKTA